eukprot:CAMPEP_0203816454 /NCGR_PEP_ID=MMETSP0115-20131106/15345_1 /ASSEMBLY_ACC=CAM_ASM_000227 /TAXON_ID=33651 /ORGANISM="Bicosoecid sp, Strain ms1" /LENGTH=188 /DNA_ID=CAMNT_0050725359 /DNA_START=14 /DNA_END=580 /DNA_ORIENTATION=-
MARQLLLAAALAALACSAAACTKEEYMAKFGAEYVLRGSPEGAQPYLAAGGASIGATVEYESACAGGGSLFTANKVEKEDMDIAVYVLHRAEAQCASPLPAPEKFTQQILAPLDAAVDAATMTFIAFPPDQEYELFILSEKPASPDATVQLKPTRAPEAANETEEAVAAAAAVSAAGVAAGVAAEASA